jgi:hypothetical protein
MSLYSDLQRWFPTAKQGRPRSAKSRGQASRSSALATRRSRTDVFARVELLETRQLLSVVVQTDQRAYAPGSTATITGMGLQAGETVDLQIYDLTKNTTQSTWTAPADSSGNVSTTWSVASLVGDDLQVTATGETSGLSGQTTFHDGSTLATDQTDYGPNGTVFLNGAGWQAGENVDLQAVRNDGTTYTSWSVVDGTGGVLSTTWSVPSDAPGHSFQITGTGESSGLSSTVRSTPRPPGSRRFPLIMRRARPRTSTPAATSLARLSISW